jgi:hypothetical protein
LTFRFFSYPDIHYLGFIVQLDRICFWVRMMKALFADESRSEKESMKKPSADEWAAS